MVTLTAKLYHANDWASEPAKSRTSIEHATHLLRGWTRMYGTPETIATGAGTDFWFRDQYEYNLLVRIAGATKDQLRAAW